MSEPFYGVTVLAAPSPTTCLRFISKIIFGIPTEVIHLVNCNNHQTSPSAIRMGPAPTSSCHDKMSIHIHHTSSYSDMILV